MTAVPMNNTLTPEDAAELLRQDARARQRDSRARKAEREAAQARLVAEREAERLAVLAAQTERIADLEARLIETEERSRVAEERLQDAVTLLAIHHDVAGLQTRGASSDKCRVVRLANGHFLERFEVVTMRYWTCPAPEAILRAQGLFQAVIDRIPMLPSTDKPVTIPRSVTHRGTPVTRTVRNADGHLGIADRSQDDPATPASQQAWIDRLGPSPYDPYEAMIEEIEHRAETGRGWDDDDVEDDDETRHVDM